MARYFFNQWYINDIPVFEFEARDSFSNQGILNVIAADGEIYCWIRVPEHSMTTITYQALDTTFAAQVNKSCPNSFSTPKFNYFRTYSNHRRGRHHISRSECEYIGVSNSRNRFFWRLLHRISPFLEHVWSCTSPSHLWSSIMISFGESSLFNNHGQDSDLAAKRTVQQTAAAYPRCECCQRRLFKNDAFAQVPWPPQPLACQWVHSEDIKIYTSNLVAFIHFIHRPL